MKLWLVLLALVAQPVQAQPVAAQRARDLGIPFEGVPGPLNAITDVAGVEVGQVTLIAGEGALKVGTGPVRAGVTVVFPRGRAQADKPVYGGFFDLNGNGEMTGRAYLEDFGIVQGPIGLTDRSRPAISKGPRTKSVKPPGQWLPKPIAGG